MTARQISDWLAGFEEYTSITPSPLLFRRWTGLSLLGAAIERKAWTQTAVNPIYPNLYVFLIAPPAIGKTVMTSLAYNVIHQLKEHKLSSSSPTRATIIEELAKAERFVQINVNGVLTTQSFNALYIVSNELGVLLPAYETDFLNKLTDIYDGHPYSETRRDKRHNVSINRPMFNMLAAGTPGYLGSIIPEVAWEQGFLSRVIMVYCGKKESRSIWHKQEAVMGLWDKLVMDLRHIARIKGEFRYSTEAAALIDDFQQTGHYESDLMHPKMNHYNSRRWYHLIKLMMLSSIARGDDMVVEEADFVRALTWLEEAESTMPEIFKAMSTGGDSQVIREAWHFLYEITVKTKSPVPEQRLYAHLAQRVPSEKARHIIELMINGGLIKPEGLAGVGRTFRPVGDPMVT